MHRLTRYGLWLGGGLVLLAALLIGVDVTLRKFFQTSLGAALVERAHIRIDSLYMLFPRPVRLALDFVGLALLLAFFGLIARHGWSVVQQSWASGSRSQSALQTPTVLPQSIWLAGLALFFLLGVALLARAALLVSRGEAAAAEKLISTRSAQEEVKQEIEEQWSGPRSGS